MMPCPNTLLHLLDASQGLRLALLSSSLKCCPSMDMELPPSALFRPSPPPVKSPSPAPPPPPPPSKPDLAAHSPQSVPAWSYCMLQRGPHPPCVHRNALCLCWPRVCDSCTWRSCIAVAAADKPAACAVDSKGSFPFTVSHSLGQRK